MATVVYDMAKKGVKREMKRVLLLVACVVAFLMFWCREKETLNEFHKYFT